MDERTSKDVVEECKESDMTKGVHKFLCKDGGSILWSFFMENKEIL